MGEARKQPSLKTLALLTLAVAEGALEFGRTWNLFQESRGGGGEDSTKASWCLERSLRPEPCAWSAPVNQPLPSISVAPGSPEATVKPT